MTKLIFKRKLIFTAKAVKGKFHSKATIFTNNLRLWVSHLFTSFKDCFSGLCFFSVNYTNNNHWREVVLIWLCMLCKMSNICFVSLNAFLCRFNLLREILNDLVFQSITLA